MEQIADKTLLFFQRADMIDLLEHHCQDAHLLCIMDRLCQLAWLDVAKGYPLLAAAKGQSQPLQYFLSLIHI